MKFVVLGAGAIGAFVGAALYRGGTDVTLVARGEHLNQMREHGVRVMSERGDFEARPPVTDDWGIVEGADVVFVGLKAYTLPEVAPRLGELLRARGRTCTRPRTAFLGGTSKNTAVPSTA